MDPVTSNAMYESLLRALLWLCELIALVVSALALSGFVIYLGGLAWLCLTERPGARRRSTPPQPRLAEYGWTSRLDDGVAAETQQGQKNSIRLAERLFS